MSSAFGPTYLRRRIVGSPSFGKGETVKLPNGRQASGAGGFCQAEGVQFDQVGFNVRTGGRFWRNSFAIEKAGEILKIARVGVKRVYGGVLFGQHGLQKYWQPTMHRSHSDG